MKTIGRSPLAWLALALVMAVSVAIASQANAADPPKGISAASKAVRDTIDLKAPDGCSHINGFNYQPSWGSNGLTIWGEKFDAQRYRQELATGKKYFPKFNAVRVWLSWSAYRANPERFIRNFQQAVDICGELDLLVVPVIFNRCLGLECVEDREETADFETTCGPFVQALVAPLKGDQRILAWDLCNEPLDARIPREVEILWLSKIRETVKRCDPEALTCIGTMPGLEHLALCAHLQDILTPHLYYPLYDFPPPKPPVTLLPASYIHDFFELAKKLGKPMMVTECCWGADDDAERASIVRTNLQTLKQYKIGFFPHALWYSGVPDLNNKDKAHLYMPFIREDGSLRPGHEVYNEFVE